jgi:hypothetical protein
MRQVRPARALGGRAAELERGTGDADEVQIRLMHKFHLGQAVEYRTPRGVSAPRGAYVVTAKLPERDGPFKYRIRSAIEEHERIARESELEALGELGGNAP